ncbi:hypothetical protein EJB05_43844, partial [Eragrostis curvula]
MQRSSVCVTGAGGFIASWLVKLLLSRDSYAVRGTVRDPGMLLTPTSDIRLFIVQDLHWRPGDIKNAHLKALQGAEERLQLLKADLMDYDSIVSAVAGCEGVFHVASPVPSSRSDNPEAEVVAPAVTGTLNVLKACYETNVKRVVVVSSLSAVCINPNWPKGKTFDEDSWSNEEFCRKNEDWYFVSKTLAEREAFAYAAKTGLDIVTICPSLVIGPLMQPTVNASSKFVLGYFKGDRETVENRLRNVVDVRDVADALLLTYEKPEAFGRHICSSHLTKVSEMITILKSLCPSATYPKSGDNDYYFQKLDWMISLIESEDKTDCWPRPCRNKE